MRVEIKSKTSTNHRTGNNGKTYGEQQAALHDGSDFPLPFKLSCEVGQEREPGFYPLAPGSFGTDKFGNLVLQRLRLGERAPLGVKENGGVDFAAAAKRA